MLLAAALLFGGCGENKKEETVDASEASETVNNDVTYMMKYKETEISEAYYYYLLSINKYDYLEALSGIERGLEEGTLEEYGIVVFDMVGLKYVNDNIGHDAGDEYIKKGCEIISKSFKHSFVYRIGEDEFVAVLQGSDYEHRVRLEQQFSDLMADNSKEGKTVIASGMAVYENGSGENCNEVFKRADRRMNERKTLLESIVSKYNKSGI